MLIRLTVTQTKARVLKRIALLVRTCRLDYDCNAADYRIDDLRSIIASRRSILLLIPRRQKRWLAYKIR